MKNTLYSATGCARCNITKRFMRDSGIEYEEFDIKADGKEAFATFYRENRNSIFRDTEGVEFPVFTNGEVIRQGVSVVIGYLLSGENLKRFIGRSTLHGEWLDGIDISGGDPVYSKELLKVLSILNQNGLKIQATTIGKNSTVLESMLKNGLVDRVIMEVKGPIDLYPLLIGSPVDEEEMRQSIELTCRAPEYSFFTDITPIVRSADLVDFITPDEIGAAAELIEQASGSKKHPYTLCPVNPKECGDERISSLQELPASALFKYRSAARRYQVMTEIQK